MFFPAATEKKMALVFKGRTTKVYITFLKSSRIAASLDDIISFDFQLLII